MPLPNPNFWVRKLTQTAQPEQLAGSQFVNKFSIIIIRVFSFQFLPIRDEDVYAISTTSVQCSYKVNPTHNLRCDMNSSTMHEGSTRHRWWLWTQVHWYWRMWVSCLGGTMNAAGGWHGEASRSVDSAWDVLGASKLLAPQPACSRVDVQTLIYEEGTTSGSDRCAVEFTRDSCTNLHCRIWDMHCKECGDRLAGGGVEVWIH